MSQTVLHVTDTNTAVRNTLLQHGVIKLCRERTCWGVPADAINWPENPVLLIEEGHEVPAGIVKSLVANESHYLGQDVQHNINALIITLGELPANWTDPCIHCRIKKVSLEDAVKYIKEHTKTLA